MYSGSGNISTLEEFFPDESALCYYCLLRGGKENGEERSEHQEKYVKRYYRLKYLWPRCYDRLLGFKKKIGGTHMFFQVN